MLISPGLRTSDADSDIWQKDREKTVKARGGRGSEGARKSVEETTRRGKNWLLSLSAAQNQQHGGKKSESRGKIHWELGWKKSEKEVTVCMNINIYI